MIKRRPVLWRIAFAAVVAILLGSIPFVFANASTLPVFFWTEDLSEHGACPNGYVALTFDDGPDPATTPRIAQELRNGGARGTFFLIGARAEAHPDIVGQLKARGMGIGNHTYDHPFLDELPPDVAVNEIESTSRILDDLGVAPNFFRPPYGRTNPTVSAAAQSRGMTEVLWTYDSDDYENVPADHLVQMSTKAKNGDIFLFHDGYESTVAAMPRVLANLSARGLCSGRVVPSAVPQQAWVEYDGPDRTYYGATTARW